MRTKIAQTQNGERNLIVSVTLHTVSELKELVRAAARARGIPFGEYIARVLADHFDRPDLGVRPRKPKGRPRKYPVVARS